MDRLVITIHPRPPTKVCCVVNAVLPPRVTAIWRRFSASLKAPIRLTLKAWTASGAYHRPAAIARQIVLPCPCLSVSSVAQKWDLKWDRRNALI